MDQMKPISSLSREYLYFFIESAAGTETVEVAFTTPGVDPGAPDWNAATWTGATPQGADATILVGPGGTVTLAKGVYQPWVRVTGATEVPVLIAQGAVQVV